MAEVLEPVLSEIAHLGLDQVAGRLGDEDLPAVPGAGDSRCPMDVQTDVARTAGTRLPGMDAAAHAYPIEVGERSLDLDRGGDRLVCALERNEKAVALDVDLYSVVYCETLANATVVLFEERCVLVAELLDEARRSLDVGEQR